ncbi:hypothetical protein BE61_88960 [Bradyrhizobium elkanii USDA 61]|nr:hypothetical protein BE61_88960 [Bradyrhizobium elkanii USDA 61]
MREPKSFLRIFTEAGPLVALTVALALLIGIAQPASAQFFGFPGFGGGPPQPQRRAPPQHGGGGWFGGDFFAPFQQQPQSSQPQRPREDFSRAPAPAKREAAAERNVLVIGDAMADWLGYGLEDAYSDQPDMGVIRKHKTVSGLIRYQPKGDPADWAAAAKGILATENPDAIVVMLGLNDRTAIRESVVEKRVDKKDEKKDARGKPEAKPGDKPDAAAKNDGKADAKPADPEPPADDADNDQQAAPEKTARSPNGLYEFRDDRWVELYGKKIEELINVLKSKGVPVLWVGLPAIRGQKGTSDMLFLDALYRDGAGKAGITYVDVWDGFVDEAGRFMQKGPDFEGQPRKLRTDDGVFFTKAGARKLAHYVEREVTRLLAVRSGPIALPSEPATPDTSAEPGKPAPRPLAGPVLPLGRLHGRHRSIARRTGLAARRRRCARRAHAGEGRGAGATRRPRRRFCLAAPRDRPRAGQGRCAGCGGDASRAGGRTGQSAALDHGDRARWLDHHRAEAAKACVPSGADPGPATTAAADAALAARSVRVRRAAAAPAGRSAAAPAARCRTAGRSAWESVAVGRAHARQAS